MPHLRCAQGKVQARGLGLESADSINPNTNRKGTASKLCLFACLVAGVQRSYETTLPAEAIAIGRRALDPKTTMRQRRLKMIE